MEYNPRPFSPHHQFHGQATDPRLHHYPQQTTLIESIKGLLRIIQRLNLITSSPSITGRGRVRLSESREQRARLTIHTIPSKNYSASPMKPELILFAAIKVPKTIMSLSDSIIILSTRPASPAAFVLLTVSVEKVYCRVYVQRYDYLLECNTVMVMSVVRNQLKFHGVKIGVKCVCSLESCHNKTWSTIMHKSRRV